MRIPRLILMLVAGCTCVLPWNHVALTRADEVAESPTDSVQREAELLTGIRQLTFEGRRAGEGYFSSDGKQMVFQSERLADNPFFQIYLMDLETGDTEHISTGTGKTTCAWIHPDGRHILYASTHDDPQAREKQATELAARATGTQKRYSWDYDDHYELYEFDRDSATTRRLTSTRGYDAEGSWSPDGKWVVFASNRQAYDSPLSKEGQAIFETDKAYFNEIYIVRSDGSGLQRLTNSPGYDGGPFFSPDGQEICWRRFSKDGALAEIMVMNVDGSDQRQITRLGAMSWAPFYHPSGKYLIFTTNRHGFDNFELYVVDANAKSTPIRVTYTDGFDGLPVFAPNGKQLAWTTNRTANKKSQIFIADWNHDEILERLGLARTAADAVELSAVDARRAAASLAANSSAEFQDTDILRHVDFLCRPELAGRLTGTAGEKLATAYVASYMDGLGLIPAGDQGDWFQTFEFTSGVSIGDGNEMTIRIDGSEGMNERYEVEQDWQPLAFSSTGMFPAAGIVFAGYGIQAPADEDQAEYDSFVHLDVKGKWVLCFRFLPEDITPERRQHLARYASLRFKAMKLRDLGAAGMVVVSGPSSNVRNQLVPLKFDGSLGGSSIPVISVTDEVAKRWLSKAGKELGKLQKQLDGGEPMMGVAISNVQVAAQIQLVTEKKQGRNVLGRLPAADVPTSQVVVVGAHVDHLGRGTGGSLAREDEVNQIHFGADDNASGVAAMLEIAQYLSSQRKSGKLQAKRDILFAAWSGEELGLLGASHFVADYPLPEIDPDTAHGPHDSTHGAHEAPTGGGRPSPSQPSSDETPAPHSATDRPSSPVSAHSQESQTAPSISDSIYPHVAACLNLDMVGRFEKRLVLQGVGSSTHWPGEIERRNAPIGLPITIQNDSYLPTDASVFFMRGVPILAAFTGSHSEYHTPRDTPEKLNYEDAARIAKFMGLVCRSIARMDEPPDYVAQARPEEERPRAGLRAYLGTIPDYAQSDVQGVKLSGVAKEGPAFQAGVRGGDVIVELAGKKIENIYDYTYAIDALKIGEKAKIAVTRDGKRREFEITPGSRD